MDDNETLPDDQTLPTDQQMDQTLNSWPANHEQMDDDQTRFADIDHHDHTDGDEYEDAVE